MRELHTTANFRINPARAVKAKKPRRGDPDANTFCLLCSKRNTDSNKFCYNCEFMFARAGSVVDKSARVVDGEVIIKRATRRSRTNLKDVSCSSNWKNIPRTTVVTHSVYCCLACFER